MMTRSNPSSLTATGREEQSVSDTLSDAWVSCKVTCEDLHVGCKDVMLADGKPKSAPGDDKN